MHLNYVINVIFALLVVTVPGFAQQTNECPRIYRVMDTLKTDPAPNYQWLKDGLPIPNANERSYRLQNTGNYQVRAGGLDAPPFHFSASPHTFHLEVFGYQTTYPVSLVGIPDALVYVNEKQSNTNAHGLAVISNALTEGRNLVRVSKQGYFDSYYAVYPFQEGVTKARLYLRPLSDPLPIEATTGGTLISPKGLKIDFPPNALVHDATGESYEGRANVFLDYRVPEQDPFFSQTMPGNDFTALDAENNIVALVSYGFLTAELRSPDGSKLNLKPGINADVRFTIPTNMRENAPETMPLWAFDETQGIWKAEGILTKDSIYYVGKVSHFSSWNCDYPGPACTVRVSAVDCENKPAANVKVCINQYCGYTDANGDLTFINAPANIPVTFFTDMDTVSVQPIPAGTLYEHTTPLVAGETAFVWATYSEQGITIHAFGVEPPALYSINGQNWQTHNFYDSYSLANQYGPFQEQRTVYFKDASGCPIPVIAKYKREGGDGPCSFTTDPALIQQFTRPMYNLVNHNGFVLKANGCIQVMDQVSSIPDFDWIAEHYPCLTSIETVIDCVPCTGYTISPKIAKLSKLTELKLYHNNFSTVPESFEVLTELKHIDLSFNKFNIFPKVLTTLPKLESIKLFDNQLTALPPEIANLADTLQTLNLQGNPIPVQDRPYYQSLLPNTTITW